MPTAWSQLAWRTRMRHGDDGAAAGSSSTHTPVRPDAPASADEAAGFSAARTVPRVDPEEAHDAGGTQLGARGFRSAARHDDAAGLPMFQEQDEFEDPEDPALMMGEGNFGPDAFDGEDDREVSVQGFSYVVVPLPHLLFLECCCPVDPLPLSGL